MANEKFGANSIVGFKNIMFAPITKDDTTGYETEAAFNVPFAGTMEMSEDASETKLYYDDKQQANLRNVNALNVTINLGAISLTTLEKLGAGTIDVATGVFSGKYDIKPMDFSLRYIADTVDKNPYAFKHRKFTMTGVAHGNYQTKNDSITVNEVVIKGSVTSPQYTGAADYDMIQLADDNSNQSAFDAFLNAAETI